MTRLLIGVSDFLRLLRHLSAGHRACVAASSLLARWLAKPGHAAPLSSLQLRMPLIGKLVRGFNTARFTRTLSILTGSAVPVLDALRISGEVVTNLPMRDAVAEAAAAGARRRLDRPLAGHQPAVPADDHPPDPSGESSGELENMLERAAISQERELDGLLTAMVGLLGPLLIVRHGPVRHGHRFCDAAADLPDEPADPLTAIPPHGRAPKWLRFTNRASEIAVAAASDLISRSPVPATHSGHERETGIRRIRGRGGR